MYILEYDESWDKYFQKVPPDIKKRFLKKVDKYSIHPTIAFEHKKYGVPFFSDWIGPNYRVCFTCDEDKNKRIFYFIGDHKEYERWLKKYEK